MIESSNPYTRHLRPLEEEQDENVIEHENECSKHKKIKPNKQPSRQLRPYEDQ